MDKIQLAIVPLELKIRQLKELQRFLAEDAGIEDLPFGKNSKIESSGLSASEMQLLNQEFALAVKDISALIGATAEFLTQKKTLFERADTGMV